MKYLKFYLLFFASAVLLAIASCNKPDIVEPEKEEKRYKRRTMKRILEEIRNGTRQAAEGFYIDKASIRIGVNPYTGYSYCYWREIRINPVERQIRIPEKLSQEGKSGVLRL